MTAKDVMTKDIGACAPASDLSAAVRTMNERGCGFLPVVESHGTVAGVVTDRDICKAAEAAGRPLTRIAASEAMSHPVFACLLDENLKTVLVTMATHRVRRLPVLDKTGHLHGVLSMDDVVLASARRGSPTSDDIVDALKAICGHRAVERATA